MKEREHEIESEEAGEDEDEEELKEIIMDEDIDEYLAFSKKEWKLYNLIVNKSLE